MDEGGRRYALIEDVCQSGFLKAWPEQESVKPVRPRALNKNDCDDDGEEDDDEEEEGLRKEGEDEEGLRKEGDDAKEINDKNENKDGNKDKKNKGEEEKVADGERAEAGGIAGDERSSRPPPANQVHAPCAPGWGPLSHREQAGPGGIPLPYW